ncbi:MAG TPA: VWA domain-containing protein, partial [Candidatus Acidoferrum sp.]|nr:VWA domain-containing protein [Candidatus Acidoferrum sp.]
EARVLVPFTEDKGLLRQALQTVLSLDVAGRLPEAFRLAQANLQHGGRTAVVHVFTDGAFETPTLPDLGGAAIRWHLFGQHGRNIGITAFEVRKTFFGAIDYQAFLSVGNYSNQQATFDLALTLDGKHLKTERITLGPEVKRSFVFPFTHGAGGILRAEVSAQDDLAVDNKAIAVIPPPYPVRVLLVSSGNAFLEKALAAAPQLQVEKGTPDLLSKGNQYDVVIIDNVPVKRVPPGRYLFINTLPEGSSLQIQGRVEQPPIIDWDREHPVMRYLDFTKVIIQQAMRVRPLGSGRVLLESNLTPLMYALDERGMKAIFVGFDLFRTDFPLRVAFPLFVSNALRWLYPSQLEDAGLQLHTGQPLTTSLPAGEQVATLIDPSGKSHSLQADASGRVSYAETTHAGIYTVKAGTWEQGFAVNLLDEGESNIAPRAKDLPERAGQGTSEDQPSSFPSQQEFW